MAAAMATPVPSVKATAAVTSTRIVLLKNSPFLQASVRLPEDLLLRVGDRRAFLGVRLHPTRFGPFVPRAARGLRAVCSAVRRCGWGTRQASEKTGKSSRPVRMREGASVPRARTLARTPREGFLKWRRWDCIMARTTISRVDCRSRKVTPERSTTTGLPDAQAPSRVPRISGRENTSNSPRMPTLTPGPDSSAWMPYKEVPSRALPDRRGRTRGCRQKLHGDAAHLTCLRGIGFANVPVMGPRTGLPVSDRPPEGSEG